MKKSREPVKSQRQPEPKREKRDKGRDKGTQARPTLRIAPKTDLELELERELEVGDPPCFACEAPATRLVKRASGLVLACWTEHP